MTLTTSIILYLITGSFAGLLAGLFGLGGGVIIVPALAFIFLKYGLPVEYIMHLAIGTSLTVMIFTSFFSSMSHYKHDRVEIAAIKKLLPGILIGAIIGSYFSTRMPTKALSTIFAIYLLIIAIQMFFKREKKETIDNKKQFLKETPIIISILGFLIGTLSGILGVGGGTIAVPFLTSLGKSIHKAIGISAACGLFTSILGTISHILLSNSVANLPEGSFGFIYMPAGICIAITSSIFAPIGSKMSGKLSPKFLTKCFAVLLLLISIKMFL